jgi:CheY-like chemotaxis protein
VDQGKRRMKIEKTTTNFSADGSETSSEHFELQAGPFRSRESQNIMVVEDHEDTLTLLRLLLERSGYTVQGATTVAEALEKLEHTRFDLLITDIALPDGSGLEIIRRARLSQPDLRGIALTGFGSEEDALCINQAGFEMHLVNPIDVGQIKSSVQQSLGSG